MTVFKTFFTIVNKLKPTIILYTALLIIFGAVNMKTSDNNINFVNSKPDILIINQDVNKGLTKNLINYMKKNSNIVKVENNEEKINDSLFYREVSYVIYIPKDYRKNVLLGKNPKLDIKKTDEYKNFQIEGVAGIDTEGPYQGLGFFYRTKVIDRKGKLNPSPWTYDDLNPKVQKYFQKIVKYCNDNGIELICVTTPIPPSSVVSGAANEANTYFKQICDENNVRYIDIIGIN